MDPALVMALLWLGYFTSHVGPAVSGVRVAVVRRWGKLPFVIGFSAIAQLGMAVLAWYYATHRFGGARGPALGSVPGLSAVLGIGIVAGLLLVFGAGSPSQYVPSALNTFMPQIRQPYGLERITRHPFFVGITLWSVSHALLASHLVGTVFFSGFAVLGVAGALHQERKVARERGDDFARYLAATSFVPFAAIFAGRQRLGLSEQPWGFLLGGAALAALLHAFHADLMGWNGLGFALVFAVTTSYIVVATWRRGRAATS